MDSGLQVQHGKDASRTWSAQLSAARGQSGFADPLCTLCRERPSVRLCEGTPICNQCNLILTKPQSKQQHDAMNWSQQPQPRSSYDSSAQRGAMQGHPVPAKQAAPPFSPFSPPNFNASMHDASFSGAMRSSSEHTFEGVGAGQKRGFSTDGFRSVGDAPDTKHGRFEHSDMDIDTPAKAQPSAAPPSGQALFSIAHALLNGQGQGSSGQGPQNLSNDLAYVGQLLRNGHSLNDVLRMAAGQVALESNRNGPRSPPQPQPEQQRLAEQDPSPNGNALLTHLLSTLSPGLRPTDVAALVDHINSTRAAQSQQRAPHELPPSDAGAAASAKPRVSIETIVEALRNSGALPNSNGSSAQRQQLPQGRHHHAQHQQPQQSSQQTVPSRLSMLSPPPQTKPSSDLSASPTSLSVLGLSAAQLNALSEQSSTGLQYLQNSSMGSKHAAFDASMQGSVGPSGAPFSGSQQPQGHSTARMPQPTNGHHAPAGAAAAPANGDAARAARASESSTPLDILAHAAAVVDNYEKSQSSSLSCVTAPSTGQGMSMRGGHGCGVPQGGPAGSYDAGPSRDGRPAFHPHLPPSDHPPPQMMMPSYASSGQSMQFMSGRDGSGPLRIKHEGMPLDFGPAAAFARVMHPDAFHSHLHGAVAFHGEGPLMHGMGDAEMFMEGVDPSGMPPGHSWTKLRVASQQNKCCICSTYMAERFRTKWRCTLCTRLVSYSARRGLSSNWLRDQLAAGKSHEAIRNDLKLTRVPNTVPPAKNGSPPSQMRDASDSTAHMHNRELFLVQQQQSQQPPSHAALMASGPQRVAGGDSSSGGGSAMHQRSMEPVGVAEERALEATSDINSQGPGRSDVTFAAGGWSEQAQAQAQAQDLRPHRIAAVAAELLKNHATFGGISNASLPRDGSRSADSAAAFQNGADTQHSLFSGSMNGQPAPFTARN